jgi:hypothetical protein
MVFLIQILLRRPFWETPLNFEIFLRHHSGQKFNFFRPLVRMPKSFSSSTVKAARRKQLSDYPQLQQLIEYSTSLREFENWAKNHSQNVIADTFAFLMQPLDPRLPCTLLHLLPATSGKASDEAVRILLRIREVLRDCSIDVFFLAFDGDSAYSKIGRKFVDAVDDSVSTSSFNQDWSSHGGLD